VLRKLGRADEAATFDARRSDLWSHWNQKLPGNPFVLRNISH
jgi:hypothetical protein